MYYHIILNKNKMDISQPKMSSHLCFKLIYEVLVNEAHC